MEVVENCKYVLVWQLPFDGPKFVAVMFPLEQKLKELLPTDPTIKAAHLGAVCRYAIGTDNKSTRKELEKLGGVLQK